MIAMYLVGFSMVLNLYILVSLIIPSALIILASLGISFYFFVKRFNVADFINQLINWNLSFYILFSLLFYFIAILLKVAEPNFNDLIRVTGASFYFNWVFFACDTQTKIKSFFLRFSVGLYLILLAQAIVEYYFPVEFGVLVSGALTKISIKVSTTLSDSNNFADIIIILSIIILNLYTFKSSKQYRMAYMGLLVLDFVLVNISGSRQGLIFWAILFLGFIWGFVKGFSIKKLLQIGGALAILISLLVPILISYFEENPGSAVGRLFLGGANSGESTNSRWSTIEAGFEFIKSNYFLLGSGSINFDKAWFDFTSNDTPLPHNSFVFLYCQYGIFTFALVYLLFRSMKRAIKARQMLMVFGFLIPFFFQPNFPYYAISVFVLSYIDACYLRQIGNEHDFELIS
ncbi:MAG: hypothetical protein CFE21_12150 [Bacteroidetes bacterium B1(2017)]|nr:MAG: hypothetical protein CFE21_12150 [Bacteroidetes bacterium B1(2017)]